MDKIISLSVITSLLFIGIFNLSYGSANADIHFCYDEVGDGHNCFDKKGKCEIANKDDSMAESPCYNEG